MSLAVSKWTDRRVRVGWTIRNKAGQLGRVCWVASGCVTYKLINEPTLNARNVALFERYKAELRREAN